MGASGWRACCPGGGGAGWTASFGTCAESVAIDNEPRLFTQSSDDTDVGGAVLNAAGDRIVYRSDSDPLGTNPGYQQIFVCDDIADSLAQLTEDPAVFPISKFGDFDIDASGNLGAAVFFVAVLWTVVRSKEYSPEEMAAFEENQEREEFAGAARSEPEFRDNGARQMRLGAGLFILTPIVLVLVWLMVQRVRRHIN